MKFVLYYLNTKAGHSQLKFCPIPTKSAKFQTVGGSVGWKIEELDGKWLTEQRVHPSHLYIQQIPPQKRQ